MKEKQIEGYLQSYENGEKHRQRDKKELVTL